VAWEDHCNSHIIRSSVLPAIDISSRIFKCICISGLDAGYTSVVSE
jgi:hypothetical protein